MIIGLQTGQWNTVSDDEKWDAEFQREFELISRGDISALDEELRVSERIQMEQPQR
jgi:hypothetical protein